MGMSEPFIQPEAASLELDNRQQQLEYLMRRFGDKVLYLAYSYLHDRYWAEDVAQEVFIRVYTNLDKFQGRSSIYTWIYHITVNLCRDQLRAQTRRRRLEPVKLQGPTWPDVEDRVLDSLQQQELWQTILNLPVIYREVIWLHYYEQLTLKDIAKILGISLPTVKIRLYRARQHLQQVLQAGEGDA
ncbi:ECF RNA polymerase sigma factor SigW [Neomoorella glycerini]|uniref:RNA polymerase sigma factor n=1 Tax=Neomoorella glycerini TaxID=55779 RepID=A0A6I5ZW06_9FIRM|nr:sigma-70 family RNA polymerase sigma factor [Moorella glycerini]QGP94006.1 ECF RNA polymerase sigma factor SigW [Moorella glycerini]